LGEQSNLKSQLDAGLLGKESGPSSQSKTFNLLKPREKPAKFVSCEGSSLAKDCKEVIDTLKKKREEKAERK